MRKRIVEVGDQYTRWTVISLQTQRRWYALCRCECGTVKEISKATLNNGHSTSCGCIGREKLIAQTRSHGRSGNNKTYSAWANMKARCGNQSHPNYANYGGRGISVCDEWETFEGFLADMGEAPKGATLERKDTNAGYSAANCIWTGHKANCQNTRTSKRWYLYGQVFNSLNDAASALQVSPGTIVYRCLGKKTKKRFYPPQPDCWGEPIY